jgi:hypothetical protein
MKVLLAGLACVGLLAAPAQQASPTVSAASSFLSTLTPKQRETVLVPFSSEQRFQWAYVPQARKGISWAEMSASQREAAKLLLASALSKEGMIKVDGIRQLEMVLREIENNNMNRDPEKYWFSVRGRTRRNRV